MIDADFVAVFAHTAGIIAWVWEAEPKPRVEFGAYPTEFYPEIKVGERLL
jgi:hypothetical protein